MLTRSETQQEYENVLVLAQKEGVIYEVMRRLLREDLFFLLVHGLGRTDVDRDWLFDRCREVQNAPDGYLDLWAREHYKSTIITFALTIQDILKDANITIGIFSHTKPIAKAFLRQIKFELETNYKLQEFFPDILYKDPKNESPRWSEDKGIVVKRDQNPKESTVEAYGLVDGQPTSKHFSLLVYDDVVTRESVTSPDMINKTTEAWALSLNLGAHGGRRRTIGTRYHFNDSYKAMIDRGSVKERIYPATANGEADGEPVFLTRESLAIKRRDQGPFVFGCQMLQNPKADEAQGFSESWLQFWPNSNHEGLNIYLIVDPANEKKKTNDFTCMWAIGLGTDHNIYVVDIVRDRLNLTERTNKLFEWHQRYQPLGVGYEQYGMQSDIQHIEFVQDLRNYRFKVTPLGGATPKNDRIRRLIPTFEQGRIYLPERLEYRDYQGITTDLVQTFINEEYKPFPVMIHDDMLDGLARIEHPDWDMKFPELSKPDHIPTLAETDWARVTGNQMGTSQTVITIED